MGKYWTPNKLLQDHAVYIIGGGPSVPVSNLGSVHSKWVIGVNQAYELGDWVDILWFGDRKFWTWNAQLIRQTFKGIIVTCNAGKGFLEEDRIRVMKRLHRAGISQEPGTVCWNYNSGISAINLAYHLGASAVVLIGFDMRRVNGKKNFHDAYIKNKEPKVPDSRFLEYIKAARIVKRHSEVLKFPIINTTKDSALDFEYMPLEKAVGIYK